MTSKKVLLSGAVQGKVSALLKRVAAVNKSNGPFDMLLCTGGFFPPGGPEEDEEEVDPELAEYLSGQKDVPLPMHFIGSFGRGAARGINMLLKAVAPGRVRHLGRAGLTSLQGLSVAYLDGTYDAQAYQEDAPPEDAPASCRHYTKANVQALQQAVARASGDVDILLTCEWPLHVAAALPPGSAPAHSPGSTVAADLAAAVRPRYHVAGGEQVFFARPPYLNKDLGAGAHVTRFIGLAPLGNAAKAKSLHALALVPAGEMDAAALCAVPEGTTASPYDLPRPPKRAFPGAGDELGDGLGGQDWRWQQQGGKRHKGGGQHAAPSLGRPGVVKDERKSVYVKNLPFRATEEDIVALFTQAGPVADVRRGAGPDGKLNGFGFVQFEAEAGAARACQLLHGADFMGRELTVDGATAAKSGSQQAPAGQPVEGCWFCLSNPKADVNLVASIGEECYVAVDKGPIVDEHVLVLPIEHYASQVSLSPTALAELERFLSALRSCFAAQGKELLAFERFMHFRKSGGNHCQVNIVPVAPGAAAGARRSIEEAAERHGFALGCLDGPSKGEAGREVLREAVGDGEYFLVLLPDGGRLVHAITRGEKHPITFGREVAAMLAGVPERSDWRRCEGSAAEEEARTLRFKALFKPYDIMLTA